MLIVPAAVATDPTLGAEVAGTRLPDGLIIFWMSDEDNMTSLCFAKAGVAEEKRRKLPGGSTTSEDVARAMVALVRLLAADEAPRPGGEREVGVGVVAPPLPPAVESGGTASAPPPVGLDVLALGAFPVGPPRPLLGVVVAPWIEVEGFALGVLAGVRFMPETTRHGVELSLVELPLGVLARSPPLTLGRFHVSAHAGLMVAPTHISSRVLPFGEEEEIWDYRVEAALGPALSLDVHPGVALRLEAAWEEAARVASLTRLGVDGAVGSGRHRVRLGVGMTLAPGSFF